MRITMIGHSTVLLETGECRILTDPWFGGLGNPAYGRLQPAARTRESLRDVSLVLVSHNHWDHVDGRYLRSLPDGTPVVCPARTGWLTRLQGARNVAGMRAWESRRFGPVQVTAVPAPHPAVALGFVVDAGGRQVYFAGDTWYGSFMERIGGEFRLDVALIPATTYRLPLTMGEKAAVRATLALKPRVVIPIHLGIAPRSPLLRTNDSPEGFARRLRETDSPAAVVVLKEGESWEG